MGRVVPERQDEVELLGEGERERSRTVRRAFDVDRAARAADTDGLAEHRDGVDQVLQDMAEDDQIEAVVLPWQVVVAQVGAAQPGARRRGLRVDRKGAGAGTRVSVRGGSGGRRDIKKKKQ